MIRHKRGRFWTVLVRREEALLIFSGYFCFDWYQTRRFRETGRVQTTNCSVNHSLSNSYISRIHIALNKLVKFAYIGLVIRSSKTIGWSRFVVIHGASYGMCANYNLAHLQQPWTKEEERNSQPDTSLLAIPKAMLELAEFGLNQKWVRHNGTSSGFAISLPLPFDNKWANLIRSNQYSIQSMRFTWLSLTILGSGLSNFQLAASNSRLEPKLMPLLHEMSPKLAFISFK